MLPVTMSQEKKWTRISLMLDSVTKKYLEELANCTGLTKSDVIRQLIRKGNEDCSKFIFSSMPRPAIDALVEESCPGSRVLGYTKPSRKPSRPHAKKRCNVDPK